MAGGEGTQQVRQAAVGEILGRADGNMACGARALQRQPRLAMHRKDAPGMADKVLTSRGQAASPPLRRQKRLADDLLQSLHLCSHRRGRTADS